MQCGMNQGVIKPPTHLYQPFLRDGKILPLSGSHAANSRLASFDDWWSGNDVVVVRGKELSGWAAWATDHDTLPKAVCGPGVSAARLVAQIFPGEPNPWKS